MTFFKERQGEDSLSKEEYYTDEKVKYEVEEERTDDYIEIDKFMRDLSLHPYLVQSWKKSHVIAVSPVSLTT